ncbi:Hypothetical predicted protein [Pelobates cultripes]|uniref:Uncharacterized protein n=1 Tax=Pelobates cultripes TaxID=61616 RepID=A0AAD1W4D8_PELCU|nr:Hypothetical predicted protein [Pelobates cultripes]
MSDTLSHSITHARMSTQRTSTHISPDPPENKPVTTGGRKAAKKSRHLDEDASKTVLSDRERPVTVDVVAQQQRTTHRAKSLIK